jgi:putative ABC transport system permease protein
MVICAEPLRFMRPLQLVHRSLAHYWRTNVAVVAGVAIAVAVLAGALLVGESVRASLRELAVGRLGRTDQLIASTQFFRQALVADLSGTPAFKSCCAAAYGLIAVDGLVTTGESGSERRAGGVAIYGIDDGFWKFHGRPSPGALRPRDAWVSPALARELALPADGSDARSVLVRLQQPAAVPLGTLHGRRDEAGKTIRVTVRGVVSRESMGEFSLRPSQGDVRAIYLPIARLQTDLNQPEKVNAVLVAARTGTGTGAGADADADANAAASEDAGAAAAAARVLEDALGPSIQLEDAGLKMRALPADGSTGAGFVLESDSSILSGPLATIATQTATKQGLRATPVLTYLAYSISSGDREIPYSVVSAVDLPQLSSGPASPPIWLNTWAAEQLQAKPGTPVTIAYDVWDDAGGLVRRDATFTVAGVLPMTGAGADATLTPEYPGITGEESLSDWDPPFPLDLSRITPRDEEYWDKYRAAPKAIVRLADGQRLWQSRYGGITSIRLATQSPVSTVAHASAVLVDAAAMQSFRQALQSALTPAAAGFIVQPVRATALAASSGVTDFGEYFLYFSFFIVVSGLLLAGLFFRLGVEQRLREVGLLSAIGYTPALVRRLFLIEGLYLAIAGSAIGVAGAIGYAAAIMLGLRTWWVGAVGTTALTLQPSATSLIAGAVGGVVTAVLAIALTLRGVTRVPTRMLLQGDGLGASAQKAKIGLSRQGFIIFLVLAVALAGASAAGVMNPTAGFFGAGGAALIAALTGLSVWLRRAPAVPTPAPAARGLWRFGQVNAAARPGRTVLSVALIAFATFVIVTVGAFRQEGVASADDPKSGTGGYALMAESIAPITDDPNSPAGRGSLGLDSPDLQPVLAGVSIARFRLRPGDDGSCLNLYRPENPRVIAPTSEFVEKGGRFTFAGVLADASEAERANPWLLLNRRFDDGAVPVIVDQTSLMYVFHRALGDDIEIRGGAGAAGAAIKLRVVGALSHSVFQSELIVGEPSFVRLFPGNEGYRLFMIGVNGDEAQAARVGGTLENRLADFGVEAIATVDRLRAYQQVENTYLSTFQALGALGLVLGTFGVGTVLLRNILERRRELALLQAIGYRESHIRSLILAESVSLVVWGLLAGAACALLAVLPAIVERGGSFPWTAVVMLLAAVLAAGFISSVAATAMAIRLPLLASLRAE